MTLEQFITTYLSIDPTSPTGLRWLGHPNKPQATRCTGKPAGYLNDRGYYLTRANGKLLLNHRIVRFLHTGEWPEGCIDHVDGNPGNNHPDNLRDVTHSENMQNTKARGYSWDKRSQKWMAYIGLHGKLRSLGYFTSETDARAAYLAAKAQFHPTAPARCFEVAV